MKYAESLLSDNARSTTVFVAVQGSDDPESVYEKGVRAACAEFGLSVSIIDTTENKENIADKVSAGIKTSRFVIADFTNNTLGVYYEAGYAKGLGREVIKTCNKTWFEEEKDGKRVNQLYFDIERDNLILWQDEKDLKRKLEDRIRAAIL
jgi:nucleoside 2-deoxyribosyltransferase